MTHSPITVNGIGYAWPAAPVVVVCIDGGDPAYFERGVADGTIDVIVSSRVVPP
jgi:phosphonoacetate hydrolase